MLPSWVETWLCTWLIMTLHFLGTVTSPLVRSTLSRERPTANHLWCLQIVFCLDVQRFGWPHPPCRLKFCSIFHATQMGLPWGTMVAKKFRHWQDLCITAQWLRMLCESRMCCTIRSGHAVMDGRAWLEACKQVGALWKGNTHCWRKNAKSVLFYSGAAQAASKSLHMSSRLCPCTGATSWWLDVGNDGRRWLGWLHFDSFGGVPSLQICNFLCWFCVDIGSYLNFKRG